jgi:hypothetical protein
MRGQAELYKLFEKLGIIFEYHEHPPLATIEDAIIHWKRLKKYLGVEPGSVSPFGLINDSENHVHLFIDEKLKESERLAFHPNVNTATVVISLADFLKYLDFTGNSYEFIKLYD